LSIIRPSIHGSIHHARFLARSRFGRFGCSSRMPVHATDGTVEVRQLGDVPFRSAPTRRLLANGPSSKLWRSTYGIGSGSNHQSCLSGFEHGGRSDSPHDLLRSTDELLRSTDELLRSTDSSHLRTFGGVPVRRRRRPKRQLPRMPKISRNVPSEILIPDLDVSIDCFSASLPAPTRTPTRTPTRKTLIEYEYQFLEYAYDRKPKTQLQNSRVRLG
jgi:hypothetical protein